MKSQTLLLSAAFVIGLCAQSHGGQVGNKTIVNFAKVKDSCVMSKAIEENETILPETVGIAARLNLKPVGVEENVSVKGGKGDLPIFNLYGPVKSCIYEDEDDEEEYYHREFDKQGRLISEDGEVLSEMYPKGLKRNKEGRIVYGDRGFGEIRYKYNKNGLLTKVIWVEKLDGYRYESCRSFFYDKRGLVVRIEWDYNDSPPTNFTILGTDKYGNWTRRKDSDGRISIQTITYYE